MPGPGTQSTRRDLTRPWPVGLDHNRAIELDLPGARGLCDVAAMTTSDADQFVRDFKRMWSAPDPGQFAALWDAEGTLFHPSMAARISASEIPDYVRKIQLMVPDIRLEVLSWAARGDVVLIEWEITGTFRGALTSWRGADRFTLRNGRAIEGVAYFDTHALWVAVDSSLDRGHLEDLAPDRAA